MKILDFFNKSGPFKNPLEAISYISIGGFTQYGLYWSVPYIFTSCANFHHVVSFGGKMTGLIKMFFALIIACIGLLIFLPYWFRVIQNFFLLMFSIPKIITNEIQIIKQIWSNRGIEKYKLFGGVYFYFRLRQQILAYFFACISIGIFTWYFLFRYSTYEKTYWKVNFYSYEQVPTFIFKPKVPYTIKTNAQFTAIYLNDVKYNVNEYYNDSYSTDIRLSKQWWIRFKDTTTVGFTFYNEPIRSIWSNTLEIWADKMDGTPIYPHEFMYHWQQQKDTITFNHQSKTKNNINKKK